jgi:hypothetical protein
MGLGDAYGSNSNTLLKVDLGGCTFAPTMVTLGPKRVASCFTVHLKHDRPERGARSDVSPQLVACLVPFCRAIKRAWPNLDLWKTQVPQ